MARQHEVIEEWITSVAEIATHLDEGWDLLHLEHVAGRWRCIWARLRA